MNEWKETKIENLDIDIIDGDRGVNYPKQEEFFDNEHCLFLNTGNVTQEGFNFKSCSFITKQKDDVLRKGKLKRHDVVVTTRGTIGNVAYYNSEVPYDRIRINSGMIILRTKNEKISPLFLYQLLKSSLSKNQFEMFASGTAQPQLPIKDFKKIRYILPPIFQQNRIASILSTYDDLIENDNRRILLLEQMTEQFYKEWFVRLRFPSYENTEFEKGVPKGWRNIYFRDFIKLNRGFDLPDEKIVAGEYPVVASTSIKAFHNQYKVEAPCVVTGRSGSLGTVQYVNKRSWPLNTSLYVKEFKGNSPQFVYYFLKSIKLESFNCGAGVPTLNQNHLHTLKLILPSKTIQNKFDDLIIPIFNEVENLQQQVQNLKQTRDLLLPRLISGKLRVKDAEMKL